MELRELPENIDYLDEKEAFKDQLKNEITKKSYVYALERWEKYFKVRSKEKMESFWEIDERIINGFIYSHLAWRIDSTVLPTSISTIKRDLAVYFKFYEYLKTKYLLPELPAHFKKPFYRIIKDSKKNRSSITMKPRIPSLEEIERICSKIKKSAQFAICLAYQYGLLPKDFEWIKIDNPYLILMNGHKEKLPKKLLILLDHWIDKLDSLGSDLYGSKHPAYIKFNTQIIDQVRKLTKSMKDNGELAYAYTLSDIRKYFIYDIARIEKSHDI